MFFLDLTFCMCVAGTYKLAANGVACLTSDFNLSGERLSQMQGATHKQRGNVWRFVGSGNCRHSAVWLALARGCVRGLLMSEVLFSQLRPYVIIVARSMLDVLVIAIFQCTWYQAFVAMYHVCCQNLGVERCMSQNSR